MAVLFLRTFSPAEGKSKCSHKLSEPSHSYDLENPAKFGVPNRIMKNTATELLKTLKIRTVPRKPGRIKSIVKRHVLVVKLIPHGDTTISHRPLSSGDYSRIGDVFTYILIL